MQILMDSKCEIKKDEIYLLNNENDWQTLSQTCKEKVAKIPQ